MTSTAGRGAGYSGTPLLRKLGLRDGQRVVALRPPPNLGELLPGVAIEVDLGERADVVLAFTTDRAGLAADLDRCGRAVFPDGMIWVAWPKRASKVPTDVTEDVVREVALPRGLVDTKVCAIDATWSGLRVVWRKERRQVANP